MARYSRDCPVGELRPGMVIEEVTELSIDYTSLAPDTLRFLQINFRGAQAVVSDDEAQRRTVPVEQLQPFDQVQALTGISPELAIARVIPGTAEYLEQHGMLACKVSESEDFGAPAARTGGDDARPLMYGLPADGHLEVGSPEARKVHEVKRAQIRHFLDTVAGATGNRERSATAIEEMLDQGRRGIYSSKGVEAMVDELLQQGSAPAMKAIAGLKSSDQTYTHCTDMSVILQECYTDIVLRSGKNPSRTAERNTLLAGFMHDIGKSEIPKDILDSSERYAPDSQEMLLMRNHTVYGARILEQMGMSQATINVAHYHHVKKDGALLTSYPDVPYERVQPLTRLASTADVYQALIGNRRYKRNWVPAMAIQYMLDLRDSEFDGKMLDQFIESMGKYPVGSLVRLTTGELAFVLMIAPREHRERPIVSVVETAGGELLTHHTLLDLMLEPEIAVAEVVDHYAYYKAFPDQAYEIFTSIRIA